MADPLECVGPLATSLIFGCLSAHDLARCGAVSCGWRDLAFTPRLWSPHVQELWAGKVFVTTHLRDMATVDPKGAYVASLADAQRDLLTEEELCLFTWRLCFKAMGWFSECFRRMTVHRHYNINHTVTAPPDDPLWGGSQPPRHYWWFRPGPDGSTVLQVNTYPYLRCRRAEDWGWVLENGVVRLTIDTAAGPNPGLPDGHPAASEALTVNQIEAMFNALLLQEDDVDTDSSEDDAGDAELPHAVGDYGGDEHGIVSLGNGLFAYERMDEEEGEDARE